jgi:hypothetical protein
VKDIPEPLVGMISAYSNAIHTLSPRAAAKYGKRLQGNSAEGALAEAVVFRLLNRIGGSVSIADIKGTSTDLRWLLGGGCCEIEVTALERSTVTRHSGIGEEYRQGAGSFSPLGNKLLEKAIEKMKQLGRNAAPSILVIVSGHPWARTLLGAQAAVDLLLGEQVLRFDIDSSSQATSLVTTLRGSAFYQSSDGHTVESMRPVPSAILLLPYSGETAWPICILNPHQTFPLPDCFVEPFPALHAIRHESGEGAIEFEIVHQLREVAVHLGDTHV